MTIMFRVSGVKHEESMDVKGGRKRYRFPDGRTWNQLTNDAYAHGELPKNVGMLRTPRLKYPSAIKTPPINTDFRKPRYLSAIIPPRNGVK